MAQGRTSRPHEADGEVALVRRTSGKLRIGLGRIADGNLMALKCSNDGLHTSGDAQAMLRALNVPMHGMLTDLQDLTDRPVTLSLCRKLQTLPLAQA